METFTSGSPSFDNLKLSERKILINPLLQVIKDFYTKDENRIAFTKWQAERETPQKIVV
jgi:hypothetical protein